MTSSCMTPPEQDERITGLLGYWRASLADEDMVGGDEDRTPLDVAPDAISASGEVGPDLARELRRRWKEAGRAPSDRAQAGVEKGPDPGVVPVVLLRKELSPTVSHGAATRGRKLEPKFALIVPAVLTGPGKLAPDGKRTPWIRREFLSPIARDSEDIPVVGALHDFDRWLEQHPPVASGWAELMRW